MDFVTDIFIPLRKLYKIILLSVKVILCNYLSRPNKLHYYKFYILNRFLVSNLAKNGYGHITRD